MSREEVAGWYNTAIALLALGLFASIIAAPDRTLDLFLLLGGFFGFYFFFLFIRLAYIAGRKSA